MTKKTEVKEETAEVAVVDTEVAVVEEQPTMEVATQEPLVDNGFEEVDAGDLIIPRMVIAQANTDCPDEAKGKFFIDVTGDAHEKMELVIIKFTKSRILWPAEYDADNTPLCRSHDNKVPAGDILEDPKAEDGKFLAPMAAKCDGCEYSKWGTGRTPPRCQENWDMLVLDLETYMPSWFSVYSRSLTPGKKLLSTLTMRGQAKNIPLWGFSFEATMDVNKGKKGTSFVPVFSNVKEVDADVLVAMTAIRQQLAGESSSGAGKIEQEGEEVPGEVEQDAAF